MPGFVGIFMPAPNLWLAGSLGIVPLRRAVPEMHRALEALCRGIRFKQRGERGRQVCSSFSDAADDFMMAES